MFRILYALMNGSDVWRENVRSERFKNFLFPPRHTKERQKNTFRVTVKIFGLCPLFGPLLPLLKVCHFGKKNKRERKRRYETRTLNQLLSLLFSRKEETFIKGGERKRVELLLTRARIIYLRFKADSSSLFSSV